MEIDNSRAGNADSASLASIKSSSDDADTIENAVETVDITAGPITQEHINQARLCNVINTVCADVLRDILLSQFTNFYKSLLKSQTTIARMPRIGQAQLQLIFPDPHCRYTGTVDQFDITLLYALIRNISPCPAPVTGWGKPPTDQPRDVSLSANVERIRLLRNKVSGHSVDGKLDDQACEDYFGEIGELLNDVEAVLGDKGYKGALKERQTQIITPKEAKVLRAQFESYRNQLKGIYNISFPKACFTLIVRLFVHTFLPRATERRDNKLDCIQFHTESQNVRQPYVIRTISSRRMQGCRTWSCKIYKTAARQNDTPYGSRTAAVRSLCDFLLWSYVWQHTCCSLPIKPTVIL